MNLIEINDKFPSELHAVEFFELKKWGKKPKCAYCESTNLFNRNKDFRFVCKECGKSSSVTVNTYLQGTRIPLKTWLISFALVSDAKKGVSALQLQRNLGLSYPTAWKMGHTIRELMQIENDEMEELEDIVEMDETFIGGKPRKANNPIANEDQINTLNSQLKGLKKDGYDFSPLKGNSAKPDLNIKRGRGSQKKTPVVGIVQRDGNVIAEVMKNLTHKNLKAMVQKYVDEDDSVLITDEYKGYSKMDRIIEHVKNDHKTGYSYKGINTNSIESFWAIIKRGIIGQYHQVSDKHLPAYVSEFVFKYNNRNEDDMFETLVLYSMLPTSL